MIKYNQYKTRNVVALRGGEVLTGQWDIISDRHLQLMNLMGMTEPDCFRITEDQSNIKMIDETGSVNFIPMANVLYTKLEIVGTMNKDGKDE